MKSSNVHPTLCVTKCKKRFIKLKKISAAIQQEGFSSMHTESAEGKRKDSQFHSEELFKLLA